MPEKMFFNLTWTEGTPTLEEVRQTLHLEPGELDERFGVVAIDPEDHLYTVLVDADAAQRLGLSAGNPEVEGPFSNPRIEPFGPPRAEGEDSEVSA